MIKNKFEVPATPRPSMKRLFELYPPETVVRVMTLLSLDEAKSGTIQGVPISQIKTDLARLRLEQIREEKDLSLRREQYQLKIGRVKSMLLRERAARGEIRGSNEDKNAIGVILRGKNIGLDIGDNRTPGRIGSRVTDDMVAVRQRILPSVGRRLREAANESEKEQMLRRLNSALVDLAQLGEAYEGIQKFRGKVLSSGLPLSTSAVLTDEGVKVFDNGQTRKQKEGKQKPDFFVSWEDIASNRVTVSVAPTWADSVRSVMKRIRGKPDNLPVTVILKESGSDRVHRVTVSGGDELVQTVRGSVGVLAQRREIERAIDGLKRESPEVINIALKDLDI